VRAGYLALVEADQGRWEVIDADRPVEDVQAEIRSVVAKRLGIVG
jgi:thymidylate kinase